MASIIIAPELYSRPPINAMPGARVDVRSYTWAAADQVATNVVALGILPAYHWLANLFLETADMDSGSSHTVSVGLLNSYYNQALAASASPGWDQYTATIGIAAQVGSTTGATTPAEKAGYGGTTPILALGCNIITSSTVMQNGGRATYTTTLTPTTTLGVSQYDRIIGVQLTAVGTAVAGQITLIYEVDAYK
jgi:hypothetical protein